MPAATATRLKSRGLRGHSKSRDPAVALWLTGLLVAVVILIVATSSAAVFSTLRQSALPLVFWSLITVLVDLFPVPIGALWVTLDLPVLLAVAFTFPPAVAALVAFVSAVDRREFDGTVGFARAIFNRSQISISVYLASLSFGWLDGDLSHWPLAVVPALAAVVVDYGVNVLLAGCHSTLLAEGRASLHGMAERLRIVFQLPVVLVLLGFGFASLSLAFLYGEAGPWAVVAFLVPTLVARQFLVKNQELELAASELERQERLIERSLSRLVDERADERLRIAGELHDDVLQGLARVHILALVVRQNARRDRNVFNDAEDLVSATATGMELIRSAIAGLRASPIARGGLSQAISSLAEETARDWNVKVSVSSQVLEDIDSPLQVAAYQVVREGLLNALKHARAQSIEITTRTHGGQLIAEVSDDGVGFDRDMATSADHFGLQFMKERTERIGGVLRIDTGKGKGTTLYAKFPL